MSRAIDKARELSRKGGTPLGGGGPSLHATPFAQGKGRREGEPKPKCDRCKGWYCPNLTQCGECDVFGTPTADQLKDLNNHPSNKTFVVEARAKGKRPALRFPAMSAEPTAKQKDYDVKRAARIAAREQAEPQNGKADAQQNAHSALPTEDRQKKIWRWRAGLPTWRS